LRRPVINCGTQRILLIVGEDAAVGIFSVTAAERRIQLYKALTSLKQGAWARGCRLQLCRNIQDACKPGSLFEIAAAFRTHDKQALLAYDESTQLPLCENSCFLIQILVELSSARMKATNLMAVPFPPQLECESQNPTRKHLLETINVDPRCIAAKSSSFDDRALRYLLRTLFQHGRP